MRSPRRQATGLLPRSGVRVRTIDTGGAGPVSALLEAARMVRARASRRSLFCPVSM